MFRARCSRPETDASSGRETLQAAEGRCSVTVLLGSFTYDCGERTAESVSLAGCAERLVLRVFGDLACGSGLLDHEVLAVSFDDSFDLRVFVAGAEEEEPALLAHAVVGRMVDAELFCALGVAHSQR